MNLWISSQITSTININILRIRKNVLYGKKQRKPQLNGILLLNIQNILLDTYMMFMNATIKSSWCISKSCSSILLLSLLINLSENVILERVSDVICVRKVETFGHFYIFESLHKLGLFFFVVRGWSSAHWCSEKRLNHYILNLVDVMSPDLCYFLFLRDHDDVKTFEKSDKAKKTIWSSDHNTYAFYITYILVYLISIKDFGLLLHQIS